jgi:hypothetical protein
MAESGDLWNFPTTAANADELVGYAVEGTDGAIGTVLKASVEVAKGYLIVSAGRWLAASTVMLPAGVIERIDRARHVVHLARSREEIERAPAFEADRYQDGAYRAELGEHYRGRKASAIDRRPPPALAR